MLYYHKIQVALFRVNHWETTVKSFSHPLTGWAQLQTQEEGDDAYAVDYPPQEALHLTTQATSEQGEPLGL